MRIALFGGTGFVGSYLVETLVSAGMHPILLVRPGSEHTVPAAEHCTVISGDIDDQDAIERVVQDADVAIYNIGILREFPDRGITFERLQFEGAKRAVDISQRAGVQRFLLMSANGVKADGTSYQRTKYMAEEYLATSTMNWTVFRPSVIFGDPRGRMEFASQLRRDIIDSPMPAPLFFTGLSPMSAGTFELSPVHVRNVAQAFVGSIQREDTFGRVLMLGGPECHTWRGILETIAAAVGKRKLMLPTPAWGVTAAASVLDRFPAFPITRDQIAMLVDGNVCTADDLKDLGVQPLPFNRRHLDYLAAQA